MIDLRSDTVTRPGPEMRRAMAEAQVGDDVLDGDPTTRALETRVAELLGMDWALFCPSGTMANEVGLGVLSRPGTLVLIDERAHIVEKEMAGAAVMLGCQLHLVRATGAVMSSADLERAFPAPSRFGVPPSVVALENTHNSAGGVVTSLAEMQAMAAIAREHGCKVHLDGARLWNAAITLGIGVATLAAVADTVMVCLSKGLGAPVGSCIAGRDDRQRAWELRTRMGGGMRQSGVIAAAARYGLEHHRDRMHEDHAHAKAFAVIVDGKGGARVVPPDTNIVMIDLPAHGDANALAKAIAADGVLITAWTRTRLRAITHLDAPWADVERAAQVVARHLELSAA